MKCPEKIARFGDEYHCGCGVIWEVGESKPPCNEIFPRKPHSRKQRGLRHLRTLKQEYFE